MTSLKIVIVDDHAIVRDALATSLAQYPELIIAGAFSSSREVMEYSKDGAMDLLLIDYNLDEMNGIEVAKEVKKMKKEVKVLMFSMFSQEILNEFKACGFHGIIDKSKDLDVFKVAIDTISKNQYFIFDKSYTQIPISEEEEVLVLSDREKEVLKRIATGVKQSAIANELDISLRTVEAHRANICNKLNLNSIAQLALYAARSGLINFGLSENKNHV